MEKKAATTTDTSSESRVSVISLEDFLQFLDAQGGPLNIETCVTTSDLAIDSDATQQANTIRDRICGVLPYYFV